MKDVPLKFAYRVSGAESLDDIRPYGSNSECITHLGYHVSLMKRLLLPLNPEKREILAKAATGETRIELVSIASEAVDIAYCVSTVSPGGRGEIDSMFVEERCRGRGTRQ